jgi:hypothetical protein
MKENEKKPIVIHIEDEDVWTELNNSRDAFAYVLKNNLNLEVVIYRNNLRFEDDLEKLRKYFSRQQVILIIVDQIEYCNQQDDVIPFVRKNLSENVPIAVLINPSYENHFKEADNKLLYAFAKESEPLINLIKNLAENWVLAHNWFDERTDKDKAALMFRLENSYLTAYPEEENDDGDFCPKDHNHMIITQALRTHLHVGPIVQEEFHDTIPNLKSPEFTRVKSSIYEEELARAQSLSENEQEDLWQKMCDTFESNVSCGRRVKGFAIDPITLGYLITNQFGYHYQAGTLLAYRIFEIDNLQERYFKGKMADVDECKARLITGLIFQVPGYQTPILHIAEVTKKYTDTEGLEKTINFLKEQQMFIPTYNGGQSF